MGFTMNRLVRAPLFELDGHVFNCPRCNGEMVAVEPYRLVCSTCHSEFHDTTSQEEDEVEK